MSVDSDLAFLAPDLDLPPIDADPAPLLLACLNTIPDPRMDRCRLYPLPMLRVTALWAVMLGADGCRSIARRCANRLWPLRQFLDLPYGIPSHHTYRRVFRLLDPALVEAAWRQWVAGWHPDPAGDGVAIDGKSVRGTRDPARALPARHRVGVWSTGQRLYLAPQAVPDKAHEISVLPALRERLHLQGCTVTMDRVPLGVGLPALRGRSHCGPGR